MATINGNEYNKLTASSKSDNNELVYYTSRGVPVYTGEFHGVLIGNATTAKQLEHDYTLSATGDATGQVRLNAGDAQIQLTVTRADHAGSADFAGKTEFSSHSSHADMANTAEYAYESGHSSKASLADMATEAKHTPLADLATRATLADKAEGLTWDMIQVVTEYPTNIAQGVLYIKVFDEFHNNGWEIIGFKYRGKDGLINTTDLSLYRIRYTNRALTEDFLEHRRIWATPSPERTLSNIKGEIEQINVAEHDTTVEELAQREAKFFKQEDLL